MKNVVINTIKKYNMIEKGDKIIVDNTKGIIVGEKILSVRGSNRVKTQKLYYKVTISSKSIGRYYAYNYIPFDKVELDTEWYRNEKLNKLLK